MHPSGFYFRWVAEMRDSVDVSPAADCWLLRPLGIAAHCCRLALLLLRTAAATHFYRCCVRSTLAGRDVAGGVCEAKYPTSVCVPTISIGRYSSCLGPIRLSDGSHESSVLWEHTPAATVPYLGVGAEISLVG